MRQLKGGSASKSLCQRSEPEIAHIIATKDFYIAANDHPMIHLWQRQRDGTITAAAVHYPRGEPTAESAASAALIGADLCRPGPWRQPGATPH